MKPFLVLQLRPEDEASNSEFRAILRAGELNEVNVERIRVEQAPLPNIDLNKYSAVIVGGSPFDYTTPENEKSDLQKRVEKEMYDLADKIVKADFPFLGVCSGNGLIGNYHGVPITNKYKEPVSAIDISLTKECRQDKILKGVPDKFRALVGHKEACEIAPQGATLLAYSETCPVEMFRVKNNVYATQFHPEADADEFEVRIRVYKNYGYFKAEDAEDLIETIKQEKIIYPRLVLKNFVEFYGE